MDKQLGQIIEESIKLERNVGELYSVFGQTFKEDAPFWEKLAGEEKNHANLIGKVGELDFITHRIIPDMLSAKLHEIRKTNKSIESFIEEYKTNPPSRENAFILALKLENSATEIHYQEFMDIDDSNPLIQTFQNLNAEDKNHYNRIRKYMKENGMLSQRS